MSGRTRKFTWLLGGLSLIALVLRVVVARELLAGDPLVGKPPESTDAATYLRMAAEYASGVASWGKEGFYYQPFYYAAFLLALAKLAGPAGFVGAIGLVQALLGAATVVFTGLAFAQIAGRRVGLAAATVLTLARMHVFYTPYALIAVLQAFWVALLLLLGVLAWPRDRWWWWLAAGLVCGCSIVTRGNMQLFVPLLLALAARRYWGRWRPLGVAVAMVLVGTQVPQLPFSIANYRVTGKWVGPSTAAGAVLALGNTPEAPPGGREPGTGAGPMEYPLTYQKWMAQAERDEPDRVGVAANVVDWIRREPLAFAELKWRTLLLFWHRGEIPNNAAIETMGRPVRSTVVHWPILLDFWLIGGAGLAGLLLTLRRWRRRPLLAFAGATVVLYCASIVAFYVLARFRLPVVPVLCGFAGIAIVRAWEVGWGDRKSWLPVFGAWAAGLLVTCVGYDFYRHGWEARVMRLVRPSGVVLDFEDLWVVKDNGPFSFGGWRSYHDVQAVTVVKRFAVTEATLPSGRLSVGMKLIVDQPKIVVVRVGGRTVVETAMTRPGLQDVVFPIAREDLVFHDDGTTAVGFVIEVSAGPTGVLIDQQRDYGRTTIGRRNADGEAVVELRVDKHR